MDPDEAHKIRELASSDLRRQLAVVAVVDPDGPLEGTQVVIVFQVLVICIARRTLGVGADDSIEDEALGSALVVDDPGVT